MSLILHELFYLMIHFIFTHSASPLGLIHEYCHLKTFNHSCTLPNEVLLMTSANYGRMRVGTCVRRNLGYLGCSTNVIDYMDAQCSGRKSCEVKVVDIAKEHQPCPEDVTSYLEASFICMPVITATHQTCSHQHHIPLPLEGGMLASVSSTMYGPGSSQCPWRVTASKGQRVNITLHNYARALQITNVADHGPGACYEYAIIKDGTTRKPVLGCVDETRSHSVYRSRSNEVEIYVVDRIADTQALFFALEYQVIGCADISPGIGMSVFRIDNDVTIKCNQSHQTWHLTCKGSTWIGEHGNCSEDSQWSFGSIFAGGNTFPYGILIVVSIGVALGVFMGGLLLFAISMYMKRKNPGIPVSTEEMYDEQRSRDKLMSSDLEYPSDLLSPNVQGDMRMASIPSSRQMAPLSNHHPPPPEGYISTSYPRDKIPGHEELRRQSSRDDKVFNQNPSYPTYPRALNHVYESPKFS